MRSRHDGWVSFSKILGLAFLSGMSLLAALRAAQADVPPSLGLEVPLFSGDGSWRTPLPIDLGADGVTDFIFFGSGLLLGASPMEENAYQETFHVVAREAAGGWRRVQSFALGESISRVDVCDLDGDGFDDLVLLTHGHETHAIHLFRQTPAGRLSRATDMVLPGWLSVHGMWAVTDAGAARVFLKTVWQDDTTDMEVRGGLLLEWREDYGFRQLWRGALALEADYSWWSDLVGVVNTPTGLAATAPCWDIGGTAMIVIPLEDDGWGEPYRSSVPFRNEEDVAILRHHDHDELWCWSGNSLDTLRILVAEGGNDSLTVKKIPIDEAPDSANALWDIPWCAWVSGDSAYLCRKIHPRGASRDKIILVAADLKEGHARVASLWDDLSTYLRGPVVSPSGTVEVLWSFPEAYILAPPEERAIPAPDFSIGISRISARGDFNKDGLRDLVVDARTKSQPRALYLLMGLDRPPWFEEPILIGASGHDEGMCVGDVDGDGYDDLVFLLPKDNRQDYYYVPYFWNGWRLVCEDEARIYEPELQEWERLHHVLYLNDYDGDGRDELLDALGEFFLGWETDRQPRQEIVRLTTPMSGDIGAAADLDGDGRTEIISTPGYTISISRMNPLDGTWQRIGGCLVSQWTRTIDALNLDADPEPELILGHQHGSTILDFAQGIERPSSIVNGPSSFIGKDITWLAGDIDSDGRSDLIQTYGGLIEIASLSDKEWMIRHLFVPERMMALSLAGNAGPVLLDIDRDGDLDLVVTHPDGFRVHTNRRIDRPSASRKDLLIQVLSANPGHTGVQLAVRSTRSGPVSLGLFDVSGRRIWSSMRHAISDQWLNVVLEPESVGRSLAAGVYFFRVEAEGNVATRRIILSR